MLGKEEELERRLKYLENILVWAEERFTDLYLAAIEILRLKNVKKYILRDREIWIIHGKEARYIVSERNEKDNIVFSCSCPDFLFHVLLKSYKDKNILRRPFCYHILAKIISEIHEIKKKLGQNFNSSFLPETIISREHTYAELIKSMLISFSERGKSDERDVG